MFFELSLRELTRAAFLTNSGHPLFVRREMSLRKMQGASGTRVWRLSLLPLRRVSQSVVPKANTLRMREYFNIPHHRYRGASPLEGGSRGVTLFRHCERSEAIQYPLCFANRFLSAYLLDCFVAALLAMTNCSTVPLRNAKNKRGRMTSLYFLNYLFENWGARRAFFKPYFFLSLTRGSRVKKPSFLSAGRHPSSACKSARAIPRRIAFA